MRYGGPHPRAGPLSEHRANGGGALAVFPAEAFVDPGPESRKIPRPQGLP